MNEGSARYHCEEKDAILKQPHRLPSCLSPPSSRLHSYLVALENDELAAYHKRHGR